LGKQICPVIFLSDVFFFLRFDQSLRIGPKNENFGTTFLKGGLCSGLLFNEPDVDIRPSTKTILLLKFTIIETRSGQLEIFGGQKFQVIWDCIIGWDSITNNPSVGITSF